MQSREVELKDLLESSTGRWPVPGPGARPSRVRKPGASVPGHCSRGGVPGVWRLGSRQESTVPWHLPLRRRPIQFLHSRPAMGVFHPLILPGLINRLCWDRGGGWQTEFLSVPEELSSGGADQGTSSPSAGWVGEGGAGAGVTARPEGQRMAETPKYSLAGGWVHGGDTASPPGRKRRRVRAGGCSGCGSGSQMFHDVSGGPL